MSEPITMNPTPQLDTPTPSNDDCFGSREEMIARYKQLRTTNAALEKRVEEKQKTIELTQQMFLDERDAKNIVAFEYAELRIQLAECEKDKERLDAFSGTKEIRDKIIIKIRTFEANAGRGYCELALNVRTAIDSTISATKGEK